VVGAYASMTRYEAVRRLWLRGDVLDIGCGLAYLAQFVDTGWIYIGIGGRGKLIETLKQDYHNLLTRKFHCVNIVKENSLLIRTLCASFNIITLLAVIEHLRNTKSIPILCTKMLVDDGTLVLTTPTREGDKIGGFLLKHLLIQTEDPFLCVKIYDKRSHKTLLESFNFKFDIYTKFECDMNQLFVCSKNA